jgi:formylmethanofuran dehydrogenase subunit E
MCSSCFSVYGTEMGSELVEKSKFTPKKVGLEEIIEEAMMEDLIHCPKCGEALEMDAERCSCGWKNPLLALGLI